MLPQAKIYLKDAGYSPQAASYLLIGLFLAGVVGIQLGSRIIHHYIPSHVVDCDHNHDDEEVAAKDHEEMSEHAHDDEHANGLPVTRQRSEPLPDDEDTPLLARTASFSPRKATNQLSDEERNPGHDQAFHTAPTSRRPSMMPRNLTRTLSRYVGGTKENCDASGPCMGFSDPCGQDCFKVVQRRGSVLPGHNGLFARAPTWRSQADARIEAVNEAEEDALTNGVLTTRSRSATHHYHHAEHQHIDSVQSCRRASEHSRSVVKEHHHHVPTNAFMSIGLQTSLAIALHKAPEGFITYATNHANPTLGFAVFMALFIHNITEGFAMSLPLYLALGSRFKAMAWSSFLGGASQPIGAGLAAAWFKLAKRSNFGAPTEGVYGGLFSITAGIMASVALSLFAESLQLSHNKSTCIAFAFLGMGILGVSFALTAK